MSIFIEKILEILQNGAETTIGILGAFSGGKQASQRKFRRFMREGPKQFKTDLADIYRKRKKFYNVLNYLKREGLVQKKSHGRVSFWKVTGTGIKHLKILKEKGLFFQSRANFSPSAGNGITIIAFDVPEKERKKRNWIRMSLINMEFSSLQKSLWVAHGSVAEEFIHALRERDMMDYVHIFSVDKKGTIQKF